jgi:hypothetical protein
VWRPQAADGHDERDPRTFARRLSRARPVMRGPGRQLGLTVAAAGVLAPVCSWTTLDARSFSCRRSRHSGTAGPPRAAWLCGMSYVAAMTDYWMVFTGERDDAVVLGDTAPTDSARSSLPVTGTVGL